MELVKIGIGQFDVEENLDLERKILESTLDNQVVFRFWQNDPSIILGRFQLEEFEVDSSFVKNNSLPVHRRFTGGGTVYHDHGNLNISFFVTTDTLKTFTSDKGTSFFADVIYEALLKEIPNIVFNRKRNALYIGDRKFLGSASIVTGGTLLFHCSILINSNLELIEGALLKKPDYQKKDKAYVESVRDKVINLSELDSTLDVPTIKDLIEKELYNRFPLSNNRQIVTVQDLHKIKY